MSKRWLMGAMLAGATVFGQKQVDFQREVRPILPSGRAECHDPRDVPWRAPGLPTTTG